MALAIFERWGLNPREQRVATIFLGVAGVMAILAIPVGLQSLVSSRKTENEELRTALTNVQAARSQVRERQNVKDAIALRYNKKAPPLAGFIEQSARANKLDVTDSVDRPEVPIGKRYVERSTVVHFKKAGMMGIAKFLETIEKSQYAVAITRLNIRKRAGEPDSYDVEFGLSAYDRNEAAAASDKPPEKKL
jgi:general secretion pathway protein M